ncbi:histidine phosphatase family protein [Methylocaldum szegediense]|jgi:probable phosphoglycerate mutase|uniref:GDP-mannose 4,6-dehydratase n=1 Tax=Methylocaldum szegediense TaxID=73780 RepID=A0ABN8XAS5_9GAMM|nr:histidine phosphatase family protein [Methylocaldum szegediense]CAI8975528.1 GDP-mannose 4,6-dehydratase [Methylocaldum szegediense]
MTTFLLIRHGAHCLGGDIIAGRAPGVRLSPLGHEQARHMAERVAKLPVHAIYSSPAERTLETAQYLSDRIELPVQVLESLYEIDFGDWTGQPLEELRRNARFRFWNCFRSGTRIPGGEVMIETQTRIVADMLRLREQHGKGCIALVSHGDVIKAAVAYFLGVPLDLFTRIEIGLASVSIVSIDEQGPWVLGINNQGDDLFIPENL